MNPERRALAAALLLALLASGPTAAARGPLDDGEKVTMSLDGVELAKVLESFAVRYRMNIVSGADVSGKVTMNLFEVPVEEALDVVLAVNGYGFRKSGDFYLVRPLEELRAGSAGDEIDVAVVRLDYITAEEALKLVEPLKSPEGVFSAGSRAAGGIESDPTSAGGNDTASGEVLVLRDRRSVLEHARRVLAEVDVRPRQVLVEATIIEVGLGDQTTLGVDFNAFSGIDFSALAPTVSPPNTIAFGAAGADQIEQGFGTAGTFGFANDVNTDGLHLNVFSDDVALFVQALEAVTETSVLANPRVLALNGQRAEIIIGAKLGYLTTTTTETATVQQVEFLDTGTQLRFRAYIAADGFIRMEIHPESSTGEVDAVTGLPSETTTEVTTNVLVRDGNTIAIGGLISDQITTVEKSVPFLGSIPVIGWLFRQTIESVDRREIIVLLTPHVVDGGEDDLAAIARSDAMANNRDLILQQQTPLSRSRMGDAYRRKAEHALEQGRALDALTLAENALDFMPADVRAADVRMRALAALGLPDEEASTLEELEGP